MGIYTVNGQHICVQETGSPNNQIALLIHGWSGTHHPLLPLLPLLSKRFWCVAVDLPGYGASPPLPGRSTMAAYADLLAGLVQQIADGPVVLVGHSMGGMISLTMALRHPVLVERMVLLNPTISGRFSALPHALISPLLLLERIAPITQATALLHPLVVAGIERLLQPHAWNSPAPPATPQPRHLWTYVPPGGWERVHADCYRAMHHGDLRGKLRQIEAPSLVLWGAEDPIVSLREAGVVVDEWQGADVRIVPKAGHWLPYEAAEITGRYIASFLGIWLDTEQSDANTGVQSTNVWETAQFLANSDVGNALSLLQRTKLAAQLALYHYPPDSVINHAEEESTDLYIVQGGTIEVWSDPIALGMPFGESQRLAVFRPGQMTGELALLDGGRRSAELRAGEDGATVMVLKREHLLALSEDDPALGNRVLWNVAATLALRLRMTTWRLEMSTQKRAGTQ